MRRSTMTTVLRLARTLTREVSKARRQTSRRQGKARPSQPGRTASGESGGYAGDYVGVPPMNYAPIADDLPDPGEVVWTWVPYEEDHRRGKDRPVLVIGRHQGLLLALQLTSQDHDRDAADEARHGRYWIDIGTGEWDRERRPSEARVDRILQLNPEEVRRIGAVLPQTVFADVAHEVERRTR